MNCIKHGYIIILLALLLTSITNHILAQEVKWKATFEGNVLWQRVTPLGLLVVATPGGLYGLDPATGERSWSNESSDVRKLPENKYTVIPSTPYVAIVTGGQFPEILILNTADGKVICNSTESGIKALMAWHILYETGNVLVYGVDGGLKPVVALFDVATGKQLWNKTNMFGKGLMAEKLRGTTLEDGEDAFIVATSGGVYKVNTATGAVIWKSKLPKVGMVTSAVTKLKLVRSIGDKSAFYYMDKNYAMAYNISTGAQMWAKPAKQSGLVDRVIYDPEGLIIASKIDPNNSAKPKINMFNYKTGVGKWDKGAKMKGTVSHYKYSNKGLILAMRNADGNYFINIVNLDNGTFQLDKHLKVKGSLKEIRLVPKGLLYRTNSQINILNLTTGDPVFDKPIKAGMNYRLISADQGDKMYVFSGSTSMIYELNTTKGTFSTITKEKISFEYKEIPKKIEIRDEGIFLSSDQNIMLIGYDGKKMFHIYHPAPAPGKFWQALAGISAAMNAMDGMRYAAASAQLGAAANKTNDPSSRAMYDGFGQLSAQVSEAKLKNAGTAMKMMKQRYTNTAAVGNHVMMMTKIGKGEYGLVKLNKSSGVTDRKISFGKDKDPSYQIDDISNLLFYRESPRAIACYDL